MRRGRHHGDVRGRAGEQFRRVPGDDRPFGQQGPRFLRQHSHWPCILAVIASFFLSFAVFLAHAVLLIAVLQPRVDRVLGLNDLPWPTLAAVRFVLVLTGAALLVALLRWTPLSWVLTGRPSRLRVGRLRPGSPA